MPNGHDYSKEYGPHDYTGPGATTDCKYRCGCSMGPAMSYGPIGVDPFGECPKNPKDGKLLGGNADQEVVVTRRIRALERRAVTAEARTEELEDIDKSDKAELFRENERLKKKLEGLEQILSSVNKMVQQAIEKISSANR